MPRLAATLKLSATASIALAWQSWNTGQVLFAFFCCYYLKWSLQSNLNIYAFPLFPFNPSIYSSLQYLEFMASFFISCSHKHIYMYMYVYIYITCWSRRCYLHICFQLGHLILGNKRCAYVRRGPPFQLSNLTLLPVTIYGNWENANQISFEIWFYPSQKVKEQLTTNTMSDLWKMWFSFIISGIANWCGQYEN